MTYYKLIKDGCLVGVGTSYDLRKYQLKHNILLTSDDQSAQYIQVNDVLYRDDWFSPTTTDQQSYISAKIIVISADEYNTLFDAIQTGDDIKISEDEPSIPEELPQPDPDEEITVNFVKKAKIAEMSNDCNQMITGGFDVVLSDKESHHFSLTIQDQLNLITLSSLAASGETVIPYHADGELCRGYSVEDINLIVNAATEFKTYHVTYFNSLKAYIKNLSDISQINQIEYGIDIPAEYQSEILRNMLAGK